MAAICGHHSPQKKDGTHETHETDGADGADETHVVDGKVVA
jgi:hypothetical protein